MSILHVPRLPRRVLAELAGLDWKVVASRRHFRLLINGKQVLVFSQHSFDRNDHGSSVISAAVVRRFKRRAAI